MRQDFRIAKEMLPRILGSGAVDALIDDPAIGLGSEPRVRVCYAPFDLVATGARIAVVGITPGRRQAIDAINAARQARLRGLPASAILKAAKATAAFSGPTRQNLVAMLDRIGLPRLFGIDSAARLFDPGADAVHFTSALRYPVFRETGKNYNGSPDMLITPILRKMVETHLAEEARLLPKAFWIPCGPQPERALAHLAGCGLIDPERILSGMPHPSPLHPETVRVFLGKLAPQDAKQIDGDAMVAAREHLIGRISGIASERC